MDILQLLELAVPVFFLLMLGVEARGAARRYQPVAGWRGLGAAFFVMTMAIGVAVPLAMPRVRGTLLELGGLGLWGIPIGVLLTTLIDYWVHRAEHRFDWLWRALHQLHHSALRIEALGAYYSHPLEVALKVALGRLVGLHLLGLAPPAATAVGVLSALLSAWQHWNIRTPHWLGYWLPRPESHLLHHERGVHGRNYGNLPLWDMLFGTFENPRHAWTGEVGFEEGASARVRDMLLCQDVNRAQDRAPAVRRAPPHP